MATERDDLAPIEVCVASTGHDTAYDVTAAIDARVPELARTSGLLRVCLVASSAALTIMRYEPGTVQDLFAVLDEIAPRTRAWEHEGTTGDPNGYAHVRCSLVGTSVLVPFRERRLALPALHRVVLLDFDPKESQRRILLDA